MTQDEQSHSRDNAANTKVMLLHALSYGLIAAGVSLWWKYPLGLLVAGGLLWFESVLGGVLVILNGRVKK